MRRTMLGNFIAVEAILSVRRPVQVILEGTLEVRWEVKKRSTLLQCFLFEKAYYNTIISRCIVMSNIKKWTTEKHTRPGWSSVGGTKIG